MNTPKWIPKHNQDTMKLFESTRQLERDLKVLAKKFATDINLDLPDYYEFEELLNQSRRCFDLSCQYQVRLLRLTATSADKNFERSPYKILQCRKARIVRANLKRRHFQLIFIVQHMIRLMLGSAHQTDVILDGALLLCALHNDTTVQLGQSAPQNEGAAVCSNTFAGLQSQPRRIDVGAILQTLSKRRSEQCCLALIGCLLATCRMEMSIPSADSDTSSVEILRALTSHLQSPLGRSASPSRNVATTIPPSDTEDPSGKFFDNLAIEMQQGHTGIESEGNLLLERLIGDEENFQAGILIKCLKLCPSVFDKQSSKEDMVKWINRGTRNLWTQVGSTLEHVVLWWSSAPLACQPPSHTKYLRDWLLMVQPDDAPEPILSTLRGLGETLTMYVTTTTWDKQFRLALVSTTLPIDYSYENSPEFLPLNAAIAAHRATGSVAGSLWCDVLSTLTNFSNSCDQGTIPNELPLVEQIPILHRLDHSIHTMRLWAAEKAKALCADWNMKMFFRVVHRDVGACLEHLRDLRVPQLVPPDPLEVHIQVCVSLRAKLVSEIKINIEKLKQTAAQCIVVLSSVCSTTSLATLSLCFPQVKVWQTEVLQEKASDYVAHFLDEIYLPIVEATKDIEILGLTLKIICEAWLDHIYTKRVKFSKCGALNLLKDFDGVAEWIRASTSVPVEHVETLAKHEVLRMCEGVGRILLRKPEEVISMLPGPQYIKPDPEEMDEKPPLPPEMFVPNQIRWLELRAKNRRALNYFLCICGSGTESY
ncbi:uncharacterized protein LOC129786566 isoform X2 [Lutzomyia longipalpis]|uniref:uncharacterized protein LOC129786566 isoform X2 n=1 Tax=Lutzomyia longipalpis TaxID=7200 RepID=UPI0024838227|nr:uncharacterized protein LOC129786566 isoform X2 [Lutzomyia longipalpis]